MTEQPTRASHSAVARAYFDYALNGILETDYAGIILQANPAACSITGLKRKTLLGMDIANLLDSSESSREIAQRHFALLHEQGINRSEIKLRDVGQLRIIEIASMDVGTERLLHVFDDVTEQRQLGLDIEQARLAAEDANKAKGNFLANMSHEIRTPLNGIIGLAQLALMTAMTPQQEDYLKNIQHSSRQLLGMLNDLLDFSKIEAGRVDFEHIPFSLDDMLDELAKQAAQDAHGKPLEVLFQINDEVPRHLLGDRLRLFQVLSNLLKNAIKFTTSGQVVLSVQSRVIAADTAGDSAKYTGNNLYISVLDSGIGIAADDLKRLFTPFSQADASITRRFGGTGLGLAITKSLVEGMHGKITVSSMPGIGSEFIVTLPVVVDTQNSILQLATGTLFRTGAEWQVPQEFAGASILVAEDNKINQQVIGDLLRYAGVHVQLANNGFETVAALERMPLPDLILMDVHMPAMDGLMATSLLRTGGIRLPIIGLSASVSRDEQAKCLDAGMTDFLGKPIDVDDLWGVLTRWLPPRARTPLRPAPPVVLAEQALDGIDMADAMPRFLYDGQALRKTLQMFIDEHGNTPAALLHLHREQDWEHLAMLLHSVKGAAGLLGAKTVSKIILELEEALRQSRHAAMPALCEALRAALAQLAN